MHVLLAFMFLTNFNLHLCYEFECPNTSHWHLRSTAVCNSSELYGCLYDKINNKYAERCLWSPSVERNGIQNVFSGGIDRVPCEDSRFQPFPFSTNGNDECVYAKSICSLEGQVVFHDLESDIDRSCKCDYTYGYAFILEPAKKCKCDPFIEDCTCYKKQCPLDSVLSPDYHCITINNWKGSITCPLLDATSTKTGDKHPGMPKVYLENDNQASRNLLPIYVLTLISILLVCVSFVVVLASIDLIEKEEIDCTETNDNIAIHSTDKTLQTYAHLHLNHSHSDLKDLRRLSAHIRRTFLARTVPAFDLYLRQSSRTLNSWRDNSNGFVKTSTYRKVLDCARKYKSILITGDDGNGITSIMRNVVLAFEEEGYEIYLINTPVYIKQLYNPLKKYYFVWRMFVADMIVNIMIFIYGVRGKYI